MKKNTDPKVVVIPAAAFDALVNYAKIGVNEVGDNDRYAKITRSIARLNPESEIAKVRQMEMEQFRQAFVKQRQMAFGLSTPERRTGTIAHQYSSMIAARLITRGLTPQKTEPYRLRVKGRRKVDGQWYLICDLIDHSDISVIVDPELFSADDIAEQTVHATPFTEFVAKIDHEFHERYDKQHTSSNTASEGELT